MSTVTRLRPGLLVVDHRDPGAPALDVVLAVGCGFCHADPGQWCAVMGRPAPSLWHRERVDAAAAGNAAAP